jgi:excisionase family DNA binding protein
MSTGEIMPGPKKDRQPKPPPPGVKLYRIHEAAWLLRLSITSVRRAVRAGKLPIRDTSAGIRFTDSDLDAYINAVGKTLGEAETAEVKAARRARARGMPVDPECIGTGASRKRKGG